jgi:eukaryotic-like serine/threonine-protein kinase
MVDQVVASSDFEPESLQDRLEKTASLPSLTELETTPGEALVRFLATLVEQAQQSVANEDPGNWARQALGRVKEWVGSGSELSLETHDWRKTKLNKSLAAAAQKVAEEWDKNLCSSLFGLMQQTGPRLAMAEMALTLLQRFCQQQQQVHKDRLGVQSPQTMAAWQQVEFSLQECVTGGGGFRIFGGRSSKRMLRGFMESLTQYAHQRLIEETIHACRHFFGAMNGRLQDRLRDFQFCRQRLRSLRTSLETRTVDDDDARVQGETPMSQSPMPSTEAFYEGLRQSATARLVLPDGEVDLERGAIRLLQALKPDEWTMLDKELHDHVFEPRGGLHNALTTSGDLTRNLTAPLLDDAIGLLGQFLPIMDVAQLLGLEFGLVEPDGSLNGVHQRDTEVSLADQTRAYFDKATPLVQGITAKGDSFLLVPASDVGRYLGDAVHAVLPEVKIVRVPGQADLMFCREQACLSVQELHNVMQQFRGAYDNTVVTPATSPHSRFDVMDWLPLDP